MLQTQHFKGTLILKMSLSDKWY